MRLAELIVLFAVAAAASAAAVYAISRSQPAEGPAMRTSPTTAAPGAPAYSKSGYDLTPLTKARIDELAARLTPEEASIILRKGTEPAFCGTLLDNKKEGTYVCRLCGLPLFSSGAKFNSGTGWPSFFQPVDPAHVREDRDTSHGMVRVEILCARCGGHLGHVFDDGPAPTGQRHCVNGASLEFFERGQPLPPRSQPIKTESAYFAGGCFWGTEDLLQKVPGVIDVVSGYQGGKTKDPTYKEVCYENTGHAETVRLVFDPARVTYRELLTWFFKIHDPTTLNRQGPDVGDQYRSAIFADSPAQLDAAKAFIAEQAATDRYRSRRIVTQVLPVSEAGPFYPAEKDHQDYHLKHGGSCPLPEGP